MSHTDLRGLRYFVAVAEERSVGRAARRLHMAQPPLSTQIKNLETLLGTPLFRRGPRGMEITEAGQALYVRAKEALMLADEGVDAAMAIGQGRRGRLTVGTMVVLSYPLLPGIAEAMRHQMPEVEVQYVEINAINGEAAVLDAEVSVALCIPPIAATGVSSCTIGAEPLMVALRDDSALARQPALELASLAGAARIGLPVLGGSADRSVVAALLREHGVTTPISHRVETATSAMALVQAGEGFALLPRCAQLVRPPGVVFKPLADVGASMDIAVCWRTDLGSSLVDQFIQLAQDCLERVNANPTI